MYVKNSTHNNENILLFILKFFTLITRLRLKCFRALILIITNSRSLSLKYNIMLTKKTVISNPNIASIRVFWLFEK